MTPPIGFANTNTYFTIFIQGVLLKLAPYWNLVNGKTCGHYWNVENVAPYRSLLISVCRMPIFETVPEIF